MIAWNEPLRLYERDQRRRGLSADSVKTRRRILNQLARRHPEPWSVTSDDLDDWLDDPRKSLDTRRCYLSGVSGFYRWAIKVDLTLVNPVDKIDRPKRRKRLPRPIPADELTVALASADDRMKVWLLLGCREGLRCMEIAGLDRSDVLDRQQPQMLWVRHGKGDKERTIPLNPDVLVALRELGMPDVGPLFPNRLGERYRPASIGRKINTYLRNVGALSVAHQLRHRFGTDVYQESKDIRLTQELLGHEDPGTTAGYAAWSPDAAVEVVRRLGFQQARLW